MRIDYFTVQTALNGINFDIHLELFELDEYLVQNSGVDAIFWHCRILLPRQIEFVEFRIAS